jgi:phosphatidylglycerophosphate synthase
VRVLADTFTALRLVVAACMVYAGVQYGRDAFGAVAAATLIGWTLDTVDGYLARAASDPEPSCLVATSGISTRS